MTKPFAMLAMVVCLTGCAEINRASAFLEGLGLSVTEAPETRPLKAALNPAPFPRRDELRTIEYTSLSSGTPGQIRILQRGNTIFASQEDGCFWRRHADWFAPSKSWSNCGTSKTWQTASAEVRVMDPLYPLKLGASGVYQRVARSATGAVSARTTRCSVLDAVEVVGSSGKAAPSYVVECRDGRRVRKTWYAPGIGPVAYVQRHRKRGLEDAWQRVF